MPLEFTDGFALIRFTGEAEQVLAHEGGGHRWQRIPPTERGGRVHTSTVTVAVLPEPSTQELTLNPSDLQITATRGSGPGGQARNKVETAVVVRHLPSGLMVRCEVERSQHQNRELAIKLLRARLFEAARATAAGSRNSLRREQVGTGMRGDKIRTVRVRDGIVTDHRSGRKIAFAEYQRGRLP